MNNWAKLIFSGELSFEEKAKEVFEYQLEKNVVYQRYCKALNIDLKVAWDDPNSIPLLPIKAFKDAKVTTHPEEEPEVVFKSSGTSDMQRSIHRVYDSTLYEQSLLKGFRQFYNLDNAVIWGYTPGYADNQHSSLIFMIQTLIRQDNSGLSRFLPLDEPVNPGAVKEVKRQGKQLILFGAAFGLVDLLEIEELKLPSNSFIIETGGMKTHRRQLSRAELHRQLEKGFGLDGSRIHSEYGMAELLSQAYASGGKWFSTVPWMEVTIRDPENPKNILPPYKEGLIGVIDLANIHSCSFLLTGDKGVMDKKGRFQVLGRWNPKDLRGCNFLIDED